VPSATRVCPARRPELWDIHVRWLIRACACCSFVMGVPILSSLGCILWLFTALDWLAALFIAIGNATLAAVIGFGGGLAMVGALYDTLKAIRSDNIPSSAQMRMRLGTL
jgi:hypothetical protein